MTTLLHDSLYLMNPESSKVPPLGIVVPEEAPNRGTLVSGELRSTHHRYTGMLAQFDKIAPHTRKSRIYLLPTLEQAKRLFHDSQGPFSFEGTICSLEHVVETWLANEIWLKPLSQIRHHEAIYWTQSSGQIGRLDIRTCYLPGPQFNSRQDRCTGWFLARRCFALQVLTNLDEEEAAQSARFGFPIPDVSLMLSDGAKASVRRYMKCSRQGVNRKESHRGYSITVDGYKDQENAKKDLDALLILASFVSRERTINTYWSYEKKAEYTQSWVFNFGKLRKRTHGQEPLAQCSRDECREFLQHAFEVYSSSKHQALLDSAIYALMNDDVTLETSIVKLFSGIQGALVFAIQQSSTAKRPLIGRLFGTFMMTHFKAFDDLWPLVDAEQGPPLSHFRNAIVHGEVFFEPEWLALSYAGEHLRWYLERIILIALGWDIDKSSVSKTALRRFYAYCQWEAERDKLRSRGASRPPSVEAGAGTPSKPK